MASQTIIDISDSETEVSSTEEHEDYRRAGALPAASTSRLLSEALPSVPASNTIDEATPGEPAKAPHKRFSAYPQRVYVLCGVVGSGKSTLAVQFQDLTRGRFVRVNQDALGNRRKCEDLTKASLDKGKSAVIDRQNFDVSQRYTWLEIGQQYNVEVVALVFQTSQAACAARLRLRTDHETVKTPEDGLRILGQFVNIWEPPNASEGFHRIVKLPDSLPLKYTVELVEELLALVDNSPLLPATLPPPPPRSSFGWSRGRGSPVRGRGLSNGGPPPGSRDVMSSWLKAGQGNTLGGSGPAYTDGALGVRTRPYSMAPRGRGTRGRGV